MAEPIGPELDALLCSLDDMAQSQVQTFLNSFFELNPDYRAKLANGDEIFLRSLFNAVSRSEFIQRGLMIEPSLLLNWADNSSDLFCVYPSDYFSKSLSDLTQDAESEARLMTVPREFRTREMCRIVWRDITGLASMIDTVRDVSALADACISVSLRHLMKWACLRFGYPKSENDESQELLVLAMGKLGGQELNVSSDIDLIFVYPKAGETDHPKKPLDNQSFFVRLGQRLIHVLGHTNSKGFAFRVDMRLRPYGGAGSLAMNFNALETYYLAQGREWERFALIKARPLTGSTNNRKKLISILRPFVYRGYTDFSSVESLREMKARIVSGAGRNGGEDNIKLGPGGIREIEFIVQACQLIYGGKDKELQSSAMLGMPFLLAEKGYLPDDWSAKLAAAYEFLRNMEHAIQGLNDQQTQMVPGDELRRYQVASALGLDSWIEADKQMRDHRKNVQQLFFEFLSESKGQENRQVGLSQADRSRVCSLREPVRESWVVELEKIGFVEPNSAWLAVKECVESRQYQSMSDLAQRRFEHFFSVLIGILGDFDQPDQVFVQVLGFSRALLGRSIYFVFLYENVDALKRLCKLCSASPWFAEYFSQYPSLLDDLLESDNFHLKPQLDELSDELRQILLRIPGNDQEAQLNACRQFKQSHVIKIAAAELLVKYPQLKTSEYLSSIAQVLTQCCLENAWDEMVEKFGLPEGVPMSLNEPQQLGFAVIAYGKLGGLELNYQSDLDLVFLYDVDPNGVTQGDNPITNQEFYTRLGQKLISKLTTRTSQGKLYEVDMRLRPSGNSGMLLSSVNAFKQYQRKGAWTWEHQALVRARYIAGDANIGRMFKDIREQVLAQKRDVDTLKSEVLSMREKMRHGAMNKLKNRSMAENDIKLGQGGMVDIEFLVQFLVLSHSNAEPKLTGFTGNLELLNAIRRYEFLDEQRVQALISAYTKFSDALCSHQLSLQDKVLSLEGHKQQRDHVKQIWSEVFSNDFNR